MMFSSNQIFRISGSIGPDGELESAVRAALEISGKDAIFRREKDPAKMVFQITESGKYAVGWCWENTPAEGWTMLPFDYDINILCAIIRKHLEKQRPVSIPFDGSCEKGFLLCATGDGFYDKEDVTSPFYCIFTVEPYTCFYAK